MANEELWQQLCELDGEQTAQRAKCQYLTDPERYLITLLNTEYVVNLSDRQIFPSQPGSEPAEFLEQLCLLAYLINTKDLPLADKLVTAESLPGGAFFFRGPHMLPTQKLEETFGDKPDLLYKAGTSLNAKKYDFGDASVQLLVLPRIPLTFVIWAGDEEFDARASILFDETAGSHLLLDALLAAVNLAVDALVKAVEESS
ncbi:MAG: DUF3786 domain-containing protein [Planctomycetota bacterium]|jgi:hypothetical protein